MRADLCRPELLSRIGWFSASECVGRYPLSVCAGAPSYAPDSMHLPSAIPVLLIQWRMLMDAQQRMVQELRVVQVLPCWMRDSCDKSDVDVSADSSVTAVSFVAEGVSVT